MYSAISPPSIGCMGTNYNILNAASVPVLSGGEVYIEVYSGPGEMETCSGAVDAIPKMWADRQSGPRPCTYGIMSFQWLGHCPGTLEPDDDDPAWGDDLGTSLGPDSPGFDCVIPCA